jgi:hypothetical protein
MRGLLKLCGEERKKTETHKQEVFCRAKMHDGNPVDQWRRRRVVREACVSPSGPTPFSPICLYYCSCHFFIHPSSSFFVFFPPFFLLIEHTCVQPSFPANYHVCTHTPTRPHTHKRMLKHVFFFLNKVKKRDSSFLTTPFFFFWEVASPRLSRFLRAGVITHSPFLSCRCSHFLPSPPPPPLLSPSLSCGLTSN